MLVFEIEDDQIKFCQGIAKERKFYLTLLGVFRRPLDTEKIKFLQKLFSKIEEHIIVSIPRRKVSIHYPSFPTHQEEEIYQMARFQAFRQFPYKELNVIHSVNVLHKMSNGYSKVMLAVIGEEILNRYLLEIKSFILPTSVTVNSLGIAGFYRNIRGDKDRIILDIDNRFTNICIIKNGNLIFSREINKGFEIIKEKGLSEWREEVLHSITSFNKEKLFPPFEGVTISGPKFIQFIEERKDALGFKDIEFLSQEDFMVKEDNFQSYSDIEDAEFSSLVKLLGLLSVKKPEIDLTPPYLIQEILRRRVLKEKKKIYIYLCIAIFEILLLVGWEYKRNQIYLNRLDTFLSSIKDDLNLLEKKKKIVQMFLETEQKGLFIDQFVKLVEILPQDVYFRRLEYKGKSIVIEGNSQNLESVYKFYDAFRLLPFVKTVKEFKVNLVGKDMNMFYLKAKLKR